MTDKPQSRILSALPFYGMLYGLYILAAWCMIVALGVIATFDGWSGFGIVWLLQLTGVALAVGSVSSLLDWYSSGESLRKNDGREENWRTVELYECCRCDTLLSYEDRMLTRGQLGRTVCEDCLWRYRPLDWLKLKSPFVESRGD